MKKLMILLVISSAFTSCTIQKRHYSNGYTVKWNNGKPFIDDPEAGLKNSEAENNTEDEQPEQNMAELIASIDTKAIVGIVEKIPGFPKKVPKDSCDVIELTDHRKLTVKILEISPTIIKYRNCGEQNAPEQIIPKNQIDNIVYSNGSKETFIREQAPLPQIQYKTGPEEHISAKLAPIFGGCAFIPVVGWIFAIMAIVHGIIALSSIAGDPVKYRGREKAIAGICLGVAGLLAGLLVVYLIFGGFPFL